MGWRVNFSLPPPEALIRKHVHTHVSACDSRKYQKQLENFFLMSCFLLVGNDKTKFQSLCKVSRKLFCCVIINTHDVIFFSRETSVSVFLVQHAGRRSLWSGTRFLIFYNFFLNWKKGNFALEWHEQRRLSLDGFFFHTEEG